MPRRLLSSLVMLVVSASPVTATAQNRFESLPGYDRFRETQQNMARFATGGTVSEVVWTKDGRRVQYKKGNTVYACDLATGRIVEVPEDQVEKPESSAGGNRTGGRAPGVARGRQATRVESPDRQWVAEHREWNLYVRKAEGEEIAVTTTGTRELKYGTGSWVYGEELRQNSAMWWSPDSTRLAYYEFDERNVKPFYLTTRLTELNTDLNIEGYPKAGAANPIVGLHVYDLRSGQSTRIEIGDDKQQYVFNVRWRPDGSELLFNRTNRHQNVLDVMAADPKTGAVRTVLTEKQETWQDNLPEFRWLADNQRFIWETEKTGWKHYELRSIDGSLLNPLTTGDYPCDSIVLLDENAGWMYYKAASGQNPLHWQLHRVKLDGTGAARLSRVELNHTSINIAPTHDYYVAVTESIETPPYTAVYDMQGRRLAVLAESDVSRMAGRSAPEMFTFKADDGVTDLYGVLFKPSDFDETKKYPLIIDVYGGPQSHGVPARFVPANPYCEFGFLIAKIDNRGTTNRGKAFESANYLKLGTVDLKDQADGVRYLAQRPYVDGSRVGITGHSYGGYMAALAVLKHPDVFHVAVAGAPVTDWRHYDTIYTERYMRTPQENKEGYDAGSCITYAENLKGKLLLLHGMVDDNVHPNNSWQLVHAFQQKRIPFDMMFFPNAAHGIGSPSHNPIKWEYLWDHLIGR